MINISMQKGFYVKYVDDKYLDERILLLHIKYVDDKYVDARKSWNYVDDKYFDVRRMLLLDVIVVYCETKSFSKLQVKT